MEKPFITAIVTGAGLGTRMGGKKNKMLIEIDGGRVLQRTLMALYRSDVFDFFVVVVKEDILETVKTDILPQVFGENFSRVAVCLGGVTRQDSVKQGLLHLPEETDLVAVHDGARPFVTTAVVRRTVHRVLQGDVDGAIAAVPMKDTVKMCYDDGVIRNTPNRSQLFAAQTPQVFRKETILQAYERAIWEEIPITDDAQMVEIFGGRVATVAGDEGNIKITTPSDLLFGERILMERDETMGEDHETDVSDWHRL
ncbi:MAG: 2-C-methyl-D-erythritol 4-phosphate cytidylyltransferase [Peptoniphilaceae bacterium]|nr:2-C-methyl-D-erythritol 4-phosphate cytidylyltransferase [Peptoniphilaceae bacterium]MDY6085837.1 2-C-methyl-D-erythritol 4-phosphate cytidylyltransferase [Peptoniphilaceae bacterium]